MELSSPLTELILMHPRRSLGNLRLDWMPQPGAQVAYDGQIYTVLERRHRYQFKVNQYYLHKVDLYVQATNSGDDLRWVGDRWVIGEVTCRYNAQSALVRCAVNPQGSCLTCNHYEAIQ